MFFVAVSVNTVLVCSQLSASGKENDCPFFVCMKSVHMT